MPATPGPTLVACEAWVFVSGLHEPWTVKVFGEGTELSVQETSHQRMNGTHHSCTLISPAATFHPDPFLFGFKFPRLSFFGQAM